MIGFLNFGCLAFLCILILKARIAKFTFNPIERFFQKIGTIGRGGLAVFLLLGELSLHAKIGNPFLSMIVSLIEWPILYVIHEAGHGAAALLLFPFWGQAAAADAFISAAGTLFQFGVPLGFALYLLIRRCFLATGSLLIFVLGTSSFMTAPYIGDAKTQACLPPNTGIGVHDWNDLLGRWGLLEAAPQLQALFETAGWIAVVIGLLAFVFLGGTSVEFIEQGEGPAALPTQGEESRPRHITAGPKEEVF